VPDVDTSSALGSAVRRRIIERLSAQPDPQSAPSGLSAAELAAYLGLHVTTVRFHLDHLLRAGLVVADVERRAIAGRPRKLYAVPPAATEATERSHEQLALLLARFWPADGNPALSPEAAGVQWALEHSVANSADAEPATTPGGWLAKVGGTVDLLARWGYHPVLTTSTGGRQVVLELTDCPFLAAARIRPDVVCAIHRGLIRGSLDQVGEPSATVTLRPFVGANRCLAELATVVPFTPVDTERPAPRQGVPR
jgi:predicted ArsR family transcriptional regulator